MRFVSFAKAILIAIALIDGFAVHAKKRRLQLKSMEPKTSGAADGQTTAAAVQQTNNSEIEQKNVASVETKSDPSGSYVNPYPYQAYGQQAGEAYASQDAQAYDSQAQSYVAQDARSYVQQQDQSYVPQAPQSYVSQETQPNVAQAGQQYAPQAGQPYAPQAAQSYAPQQPQVANDGRAAQPVAPMYYPPFPFYYPFQMMQRPQAQMPFSQGMSQGQSQSQGAYPTMVSLSQFGSAVDESGNPSGFPAPVPGLFYNPFNYGYNSYGANYQPGVAYREVYYPGKASADGAATDASVDAKDSNSPGVTAKAEQGRSINQEKEKKSKCKEPKIMYHAKVKPLSKEKKESLPWLNDPKSVICNEKFEICECENNDKTELRWSFDSTNNICVTYKDPCPGKNKNSFKALNECLVSCWRM